ncbi:MAG: hypothetical protein M1391_09750, partial [Bacteroidetes bacterium]|nr:hypothetical protein [Bacteroidota bacterium]
MVDKNTSRLLLLIFIVSSSILLLVGYVFYTLQRDEITRNFYSELQTISNLKEKQIVGWYKERLELAEFVRNDQSLVSNLKLAFNNGAKFQTRLINWLEAFGRDSNFTESMFFNPDVKVRIVAKPYPQIAEPGRQLIAEALKKKDVAISGFHVSETEESAHIDIAIPFYDSSETNNQLVGILFIRIDPQKFLFPLIQNWEGNSKSGESFLVSKERDSVVFVNTLRNGHNVPLKMKLSLNDTSLPAARLVLGKEGFFEGIDYRHVPVL